MSVVACLSLIFVGIFSGTGAAEDLDLSWTNVYTVKAWKTSLMTGLRQSLETWYDGECNMSRIDYSDGSVKKIIDGVNGLQFKIHPETTEDETNKIVCEVIADYYSVEDILPSTEEFNMLGSEYIAGEKIKIFYHNTTYNSTDTRRTLWVSKLTESWIPVRYEVIIFDTWLGSATEHTTWEYFDYNDTIAHEVFNTTLYDCMETIDNDNDTKKMNTEMDDHHFYSFKIKHKREYNDENEHEMRQQIFQKSMRLVNEINSQDLGYTARINQFSDRTEEELMKHTGLRIRIDANDTENNGTIPFPYSDEEVEEIVQELDANLDLRLEGLLSPVRYQGECGACWAFATTTAVEGALARKNDGRLLRLSEQAILDCAWGFGGLGCNGGDDVDAYKWITKHGLPTEEEYGPYIMQNAYCLINNMNDIYSIEGFTDVTPYNVDALKVAVAFHGPVSVSVHISEAFYSYDKGIFYDSNCSNVTEDLDHEVALVGYGEKDNETYWIIRNSWGPHWGIDGYMYISTRDNNCGITNRPTYAVV